MPQVLDHACCQNPAAPSCTCLQVVKNHQEEMARAPNHSEIQNFLWNAYKEVARLWLIGTIPRDFQPIWSLDNAPVHAAAYNDPDWRQNKPPGCFTQVKPPTYSPDLHKIIEHVHGTVVTAAKKELLSMNTEPEPDDSIQPYFEMYRNNFHSHITAQSVQADITSLPTTYAEVIKDGGGYPARRFR